MSSNELSMSMDSVLEKVDNVGFEKLEKIIEIFIHHHDVDRFNETLKSCYGAEHGAGIFHYLMSDTTMDALPNPSMQLSLDVLNGMKALYGPSIKSAIRRMIDPLSLEAIGYSGDEKNTYTNLLIRRNDGEKLAVQVDMNASLLFAKQTIEIIRKQLRAGNSTIHIDSFNSLLTEIGEFVKQVQENIAESKLREDAHSEVASTREEESR